MSRAQKKEAEASLKLLLCNIAVVSARLLLSTERSFRSLDYCSKSRFVMNCKIRKNTSVKGNTLSL